MATDNDVVARIMAGVAILVSTVTLLWRVCVRAWDLDRSRRLKVPEIANKFVKEGIKVTLWRSLHKIQAS